jgi:hypothetical protein
MKATLSRFQTLEECIERSRKLLDLEDNWDGQGAMAYKAETWRRALRACNALRQRASEMRAPRAVYFNAIKPGPLGSLDVEVELPRHRLFVNIPGSEREEWTYFGSHDAHIYDCARGSEHEDPNFEGLAEWMVGRM